MEKRKKKYMENFEEYMQWYLSDNELSMIDLISSREIVRGYYHLRAFYPCNYGDSQALEGDFSRDNLYKQFKGQEFQYKRPLGLWLEYLFVEEFGLESNIDDCSRGAEGWDFIWNGEKVDMKLSFKTRAKSFKNKSIYNREIVLNELDVYVIMEMLRVGRTDPNYPRMREIILHNVMKKALDIGVSKTSIW